MVVARWSRSDRYIASYWLIASKHHAFSLLLILTDSWLNNDAVVCTSVHPSCQCQCAKQSCKKIQSSLLVLLMTDDHAGSLLIALCNLHCLIGMACMAPRVARSKWLLVCSIAQRAIRCNMIIYRRRQAGSGARACWPAGWVTRPQHAASHHGTHAPTVKQLVLLASSS